MTIIATAIISPVLNHVCAITNLPLWILEPTIFAIDFKGNVLAGTFDIVSFH